MDAGANARENPAKTRKNGLKTVVDVSVPFDPGNIP
jgi:hypothetical protein